MQNSKYKSSHPDNEIKEVMIEVQNNEYVVY